MFIINKPKIRLESISIENFKNVKKGQLSFSNCRKNYRTSILGLYGQNGSGKTALIDAVALMKVALQGQVIPSKFADYINVESEYAKLCYEFSIIDDTDRYNVFYEFKLSSKKEDNTYNIDGKMDTEGNYKVVILDEILSFSYETDNCRLRKSTLINTSAGVFTPISKYECLVGNNKDTDLDLMVEKRIAYASSRSFIFSNKLLNTIKANNTNREAEYYRYVNVLDSLVYYGNFEVFVINTENNGIISLNMLPISFKFEKGRNSALGSILIPLNDAIPVPEDTVSTILDVISNMNIVLSKIVPDLTIKMEILGEVVNESGRKDIRVQLMSLKNKKSIPLKYESEGIKKIVSILQLLIVVYNNDSITVAIDELDSGVFEYLLGELLNIISENGRGQLIFTSHNLRPLETIDRGFIAFTTTNPFKRYIRLKNIKDNNNLRDLYFGDIVLGGQSEEIYAFTNNAEINLAFMEAGEFIGT